MENVSTVALSMIREFGVSIDKVFDAWTKPEMMRQWLFTLKATNKVAVNEPVVGGQWEIVDHRQGKDYRAVGEYLLVDAPHKLVLTFMMPELSPVGYEDLFDTLTVELKANDEGTSMIFTQEIHVIHEPEWTAVDIEKAEGEWLTSTEQGWHYMFLGLKELLETGSISYTG
ncbi:SRPBCC family protein [Fundicoccus culcitae]|uniref:SRPBCC domain-containing protein n=1 Tax=Fundicoccus culcitae TaxID=2969821 RepID=A0ABY5P9K5_9LACT|nr:SRPBCC family protein [Fundicoccus culcitae]UUX35427.1 SRPBCC domain-containing protein [Fundicoccus culcitae]